MIERICNGIARPETYTDSKGRFSFAVDGARHGFTPDASYGGIGTGLDRGMPGTSSQAGGLGSSGLQTLWGCDLRASLPGYRSDTVTLTGRRRFDNDVGTIVLHRMAVVEGYTISVTTALAPKKAQQAYRKGLNEARKEKWDKAEAQLRKAVAEYPQYAVAWQALGQVYEALGRAAEAREAYDKAVGADRRYVSPHLKIALLAARERDWQEMAAASGRVIKLNPFDFPEVYYYNSVASLNLNDLAGAEQSAREAIERHVGERYPQVESLLGLVLARQGDYVEASEHLRKYLELAPDAEDAEVVRSQIAQIEQHLAEYPPQ